MEDTDESARATRSIRSKSCSAAWNRWAPLPLPCT